MSDENTFFNFLREMRADRKSESFDAMAEKLIAEKKIRTFLSALTDQGFVIQESLDEAIGFDFLVRKFNDEVLIVFKYDKKLPSIFKEELHNFYRVLKYNSLSRGLIVTWILQDNHPSVYLGALELNKLLRGQTEEYSLKSETKPLKECILNTFGKPISVITDLKGVEGKKAIFEDRATLRSTFSQALHNEFTLLKAKQFKLPHKRKALDLISTRDLRVLEDLFESTLDGKWTKGQMREYLERVSRMMGE